jgi:site-specific recombinase XerD
MESLALVLPPVPDSMPNWFGELRATVLNGVVSANSKRNYAKALDELQRFCEVQQRPLSRGLLLEFRASMLERELSASTINVKLSAIRNLINEAKRADVAGAEEAIPDGRHPESPEAGDPPGKLAHPGAGEGDAGCSGPSTLNGKRDCVILALLVGCALRRRELASLYIEEIQMREGRWVIADLRGKGRRIRTIAVPVWVKQGIDAWMAAAKIEGTDCCSQCRRPGS